MHAIRLLRSAFFFLLATAGLLAADPYKVGDTLEPFTVKDQHEKEYKFEAGKVTTVIVSFNMSEGKDANTWFAKQGASYLPDRKAVFIANIHGMPGIGRFFALPKMKKYPHPILLGDSETLLQRYPTAKGKLTVLSLDPAGKITAISHLDPEKEMEKLFPAAPAPAK